MSPARQRFLSLVSLAPESGTLVLSVKYLINKNTAVLDFTGQIY